jgi:hypothetical protein
MKSLMVIDLAIGGSGSGISPVIISAVITGVVALITAGIVAYYARRQWITAQDKLAIELFDRRFAAWMDFDHASAKLMLAIRDAEKNDVNLKTSTENEYTELITSFSRARFLFGDDFRFAVLSFLDSVDSLRACIPQSGNHAPTEDIAIARFVEIEAVLNRYMMLDRIGVAKPQSSTSSNNFADSVQKTRPTGLAVTYVSNVPRR